MAERVRPMAAGDSEPSVADLMKVGLEQLRAMLRGEARLARREVERKVKLAGIGLAMLAGALVLALAVVVMLLVTVMVILAALGVATWLAALLATLSGAAGAAGLAWAGLQRLKADHLLPQRTLRQLQRNRRAVEEQMR